MNAKPLICMVPGAGVEPARCFHRGILSDLAMCTARVYAGFRRLKCGFAYLMRHICVTALLLVSTPSQADYFYGGIGLGQSAILFGAEKWQDNGEAGCSFKFGHRHHLSGGFYGDIGFSHYSQCLSGPPFNDDWESSSDHLFYFIEYRI